MGLAERYYRETLRIRQLAEGFDLLEDDLKQIDEDHCGLVEEQLRPALRAVLGSQRALSLLRESRHHILNESAEAEPLRLCIHLTLLAIAVDRFACSSCQSGQASVFHLKHQYIDRETSAVRTEALFGDRFIQWAYQPPWEDAGWLCRTLSSSRLSSALSFLNYETPFASRLFGAQRFMTTLGIDWSECVESPEDLDTPRKVFERKVRYWERRPMENDPETVASPCDARVLIGSCAKTSSLFLKNKFFHLEELLVRRHWTALFHNGSYAIFRLTPDKYHYNHHAGNRRPNRLL